MDNPSKIKQYIRKMSSQTYTDVYLAKVVAVDGDTCTIDLDGLEIDGVSLRPVQDDSNMPLRITPAVGAFVIVADLTEGHLRQLAVIAASEAEKIELHGGDNGGLVNIESLKAYLDAFKIAVSTALNAIGEGSLASGSAGKTTFEGAMQQAAQYLQTLEDTAITH